MYFSYIFYKSLLKNVVIIYGFVEFMISVVAILSMATVVSVVSVVPFVLIVPVVIDFLLIHF